MQTNGIIIAVHYNDLPADWPPHLLKKIVKHALGKEVSKDKVKHCVLFIEDALAHYYNYPTSWNIPEGTTQYFNKFLIAAPNNMESKPTCNHW